MKLKKGVARDSRRKAVGRARSSAPAKTAAKKSKKGREVLSLMASVEEPESRQASIAKLLNVYRPLKKTVNMRMDADVLEWFKQGGRKYQTRINRALRKLMVEGMKEQEREKES